MKNEALKRALAELPEQISELQELIDSFLAQVKSMPQGADRWELEEWVIQESHRNPAEVRTKPSWSRQGWLVSECESKDAARRYRVAGKIEKALACEADAKIAKARAAWMECHVIAR